MPEPKNPIETALDQLLQERADLDIAISALQKRLGRPITGSTSTGISASSASQLAGEIVVYRGEFFNMSLTRAAEKLLKRVGQALKTPQIMDALLRAGYELKGKTPRASVYTSLARSKGFVKVLPDTWALAEWHPEAAAFKEEAAKSKKPKKPRGKGRTKVQKVEPVAELKTVA
jgi:hypothetical protein